MKEFLQYLIPGISDGAIYAIAALGLVLTYKTSGVFNFAHGAVAAAGAYAFYQFRDRNHLPWPIAAILALIIIGLIGGLLLERMATALAGSPPVMLVVATVGLLALLDSLATAIYGPSQISFRAFLPTSGPTIDGDVVTGGHIIIVIFTLALAAALFVFFKRSRLGVAMTAVVDNPDLLNLQGVNPSQVRRVAWIMGATFAGVSGMLLAPDLGLSVADLILLAIAAYGAAAVGLFDSLPLTVLGGFLIGIAVDVFPYFTRNTNNFTVQSINRNIPFIVLFAILVFVPGRRFVQRGSRVARRLRPVRSVEPKVMVPAIVAGWTLLIFVPMIVNRARIDQYSTALGYAVVFASLALITWTSGQISLCQLAFAALGATTCAHAIGAGVPFLLAVLLGGLVTVPAAAIVAIPAIRLSGVYVAIATFGFGILLQEIFFPSFLMFGVLQTVPLPRPHIFGISFSGDQAFYYLSLFITGVACVLIVLVLRSRLGRLLRALSDSPTALDAHGANTTITKVLVFCISAFLAGVGGVIISGVPQSASGSTGGTYDFTNSLLFVAILAFCGRRALLSPFIAAFVYEVLKIYPFFDKEVVIRYEGVVFGALAVLVAIAPGIAFRRMGKRASQRSGRSVLADRMATPRPARPIQPAARRPRLVPALAAAVNGQLVPAPALARTAPAPAAAGAGAGAGGSVPGNGAARRRPATAGNGSGHSRAVAAADASGSNGHHPPAGANGNGRAGKASDRPRARSRR